MDDAMEALSQEIWHTDRLMQLKRDAEEKLQLAFYALKDAGLHDEAIKCGNLLAEVRQK